MMMSNYHVKLKWKCEQGHNLTVMAENQMGYKPNKHHFNWMAQVQNEMNVHNKM